MKIQCYDNYHKQKLLFVFNGDGGDGDDEIWDIDSFGSKYCFGNLRVEIQALTGEDPDPRRWSDLSDFKIIK